jgi:hypothetical protein
MPRHDITDACMEAIADLVGQIVQHGGGFKVYPPKEITNDPAILEADDVIDRLADAKFWLRLGDDTEELLTLPELLALTYSLLAIRKQFSQALKDKKPKGAIQMNVGVDVAEMMKPANAWALLQRVNFEGVAK